MQGMKGEMAKNMGNMFTKMMGIMGKSPEDLLTDEQIQKLLSETYKKVRFLKPRLRCFGANPSFLSLMSTAATNSNSLNSRKLGSSLAFKALEHGSSLASRVTGKFQRGENPHTVVFNEELKTKSRRHSNLLIRTCVMRVEV